MIIMRKVILDMILKVDQLGFENIRYFIKKCVRVYFFFRELKQKTHSNEFVML